MVNSVAHRNELREWTLPGSFLSPLKGPITSPMDVCVGKWGGCVKLCTHMHTHTLPPPSHVLFIWSGSELSLPLVCPHSYLFLLGPLYMPGRHCTVLYVSCLLVLWSYYRLMIVLCCHFTDEKVKVKMGELGDTLYISCVGRWVLYSLSQQGSIYPYELRKQGFK